MNHLAGQHSFMMVDVATGFALDSHEAQPEIDQVTSSKRIEKALHVGHRLFPRPWFFMS